MSKQGYKMSKQVKCVFPIVINGKNYEQECINPDKKGATYCSCYREYEWMKAMGR